MSKPSDSALSLGESAPTPAQVLETIIKFIQEDPSDIDLSGLRIFALEEVHNALEAHAENTHTISLKKNLLHEITPFPSKIAVSLKVLDFYDNKIRRMSNLSYLKGVTKLDLSYNQIERIEDLEGLVELEELYLVENRIKSISGLNALKKLRILELGGNKIRSVPKESLEGLESLEELYLGKNKITAIGDLSGLPKLRTVSLQANRFCEIPYEAFAGCKGITQLYIGENGIARIDPEPLRNMSRLAVLDVSMNPITSLSGIEEVSPENLREFWCTGAKIASFEEVQRLAGHANLETVFFEQNPIQQKENRYRWRVAAVLPQVKMVDLTPISKRMGMEESAVAGV